jgi:Uma2 family endonuclease
MNARIRPPAVPTRHKITRTEFHAMWEAGVFDLEMELELIDGELIEMAGDGARTIEWNWVMVRWLNRTLSDDYAVVPDKSLGVTETSEPKPDIWVFDAKLKVADLMAKDTLLVIEVSDSTLRADLKKAEIYAEGGVRDYWVVDVEQRQILVHRLQADGTYGKPTIVGETEHAEALLIPGLSFRIADFQRLADV